MVETGLLRAYHPQDGKEINTYLAFDNDFIFTYSSFISQSSSFKNLETIEDSIIYSLSYNTLKTPYIQFPNLEELERILTDKISFAFMKEYISCKEKPQKTSI